MNSQQVIMLGLVVVIGAVAGYSIFSRQDSEPEKPTSTPESAVEMTIRAPDRDPANWDLSRLPGDVEPLRDFKTEKGVRVQVLEEGKGKPVHLGRPIDLRVELYLLTGTKIQNDVARGIVFGQRRPGLEGFMDGLTDIRPYERRRIFVPNELAHGNRTIGQAPPHADVVYDVRWVYFQITELREGMGKEAKDGSTVKVFYRGKLEDGTVFDETKEGEPATFMLKQGAVIDGFRIGIKGMKEGGERRIWIPGHMAYKEMGRRPKIGPWANLIFVVELLQVVD